MHERIDTECSGQTFTAAGAGDLRLAVKAGLTSDEDIRSLCTQTSIGSKANRRGQCRDAGASRWQNPSALTSKRVINSGARGTRRTMPWRVAS